MRLVRTASSHVEPLTVASTPIRQHIPSNSPYPLCVAKYNPSRLMMAATTSICFIAMSLCSTFLNFTAKNND